MAPGWRRVDFISDLHLHAAEPGTALAWQRYLAAAEFDALFILGDLFEVWVGDDALDAAGPAHPERAFARTCADALRACAAQRPVYVMHGNRDFLLGEAFHRHTGTHPLPDPCVLDWPGQRLLLSHGDAWCLDDHAYQRFRAQVRTAAWQTAFLAQPLDTREQVARGLRQDSEARKAQGRAASPTDVFAGYADVDRDTARNWLRRTGARVLVHGHTHRPGEHDLGDGLRRLVLSDWDAAAEPPRGGALCLHADGHWERRPWPV
ncbi:UDP-2,3-diacylglucosamine diphosphatase [Aquabacterium sp. A08]|uniref:UDP-2,3-diacylglucosamine diphosphatase n=1 Tax=Aquabacterium sp. A08 TaxID=2718532 RepID=UPI0035300E9E